MAVSRWTNSAALTVFVVIRNWASGCVCANALARLMAAMVSPILTE